MFLFDYTSVNSQLTSGRQQFNKKIWRDVVEKRGEVNTNPTKAYTPTTPKKRGGRNRVKSQDTAIDSQTDPSETPSKKRKMSAKNGDDDDEEIKTPVKKVKEESI